MTTSCLAFAPEQYVAAFNWSFMGLDVIVRLPFFGTFCWADMLEYKLADMLTTLAAVWVPALGLSTIDDVCAPVAACSVDWGTTTALLDADMTLAVSENDGVTVSTGA